MNKPVSGIRKSILGYPLLMSAVALAMLFHGVTFIHTMPKTYDAYVHIFFADHYAKHWFETWEYRWYTGFSVTSYPPLLHQMTAMLSLIIGLKAAFITIFFFIIAALVIGVYRFSRIWVQEEAAQFAALLSIITPSIVEAAHVFGQLPTLLGISLMLNALPDVYYWIRGYSKFHALSSLSLLLVLACSHHVTLIFGQVFFILPTIAVAIFDRCDIKEIFWQKKELKILIIKYLQETLTCLWRIVPFFVILLIGIIIVIFPYWNLSKTDPIAQVSIPHGSRDNFLLKRSSGTIFFVALWGMLLPFFAYAVRRAFQHRNLFLLLPLVLLFIFGTGGTTPIPKILLGENAFNILTLDRFSFWATILTLPYAGEFFWLLLKGKWGEMLQKEYGKWAKNIFVTYIVAFFLIGVTVLSNLGFWDVTQPQTIDIEPISNFLSRDEHNRWRYLTLGFGDQMAWLSANTDAQCIDGNYHSARRLPELTTRAIERLENAKFNGIQGIGSLQQFLTVPEKYYLKYIFSNDKFYEPLLHYAGWNKVQRLENGIMVWEKQDVPKIPPQSPAIQVPHYQKLMWAIIPMSVLCFAILVILLRQKKQLIQHDFNNEIIRSPILGFSKRFWKWQNAIIIITPLLLAFFVLFDWLIAQYKQSDPEQIVVSYYDFLDKKRFDAAYSLFGKEEKLSFEQYALEISVEDGVINSFAKLDAVTTQIVEKNDSSVLINATIKWVTPLESYQQTNSHLLRKIKGEWRLQPKSFDLSIPPDEAFRRSTVQFFNQGKRRVSTNTTNLEDVLDRPELNIIHARLVKNKDRYSVVGTVQNIDNYPAHLTVTAVLYDKNGTKITEYSPLYATHHKILPKEVTPFRVDFENILARKDSIGAQYKPDTFQPYIFENAPMTCVVFAQAVAEEKNIYKNADIQTLVFDKEQNSIHGQLVNSGVLEITIPQLVLSYYNQDDELIWVEKAFLPYGIRPQRSAFFTQKTPNNLLNIYDVYILKEKDKYVNGLLNSTFVSKHKNKETIPDDAKIYVAKNIYVKVSVNSFYK